MKIILASPRGFCAGVNMAIDTLELAAGGGWISRETFNASDNPNKGSRIIPWPPQNNVSNGGIVV
jgi:hypothetical protein